MSDIEKHRSRMGPDRRKEEDPNNDASSDRDLEMPQMVVALGNDSSDEVDSDDNEGAGPQGDGYMLLPDVDQDVELAENEGMDADDECAAAPSNQQQQELQQQQQPELPSHLTKLMPTETPAPDPSTLVSFTDTPGSLKDRRQAMAADDEIQKAMAGFSLPGTAIPPWARALGDKEWKEQLTTMIRGREEMRHGTDRSHLRMAEHDLDTLEEL